MATTDRQTFEINRLLDAPRPLVYQCFTDPQHLRHWWGPKEVEIVNARMDFRVGGLFHYGMKWPTGNIMWGRFEFREIVVPERIVFLNGFSDENAGLVRAPFFDGKWPLEMLTVFEFENAGGDRTRFKLTWRPYNASAEEQATFAANHASMAGGWAGSLEKLETYLTRVRS